MPPRSPCTQDVGSSTAELHSGRNHRPHPGSPTPQLLTRISARCRPLTCVWLEGAAGAGFALRLACHCSRDPVVGAQPIESFRVARVSAIRPTLADLLTK